MTPDKIKDQGKRQISKYYNDALEASVKRAKDFLRRAERVNSGKIKPPAGLKTEKQIEAWKRGYLNRYLKKLDVVNATADELRNAGVKARKSITESMTRLYGSQNKTTIKKLDGITVSGLSPLKQKQIKALLDKTQTAFSKIALKHLGNGKGIPAQLRREFAAGILKGENHQQLIERIRKVTGTKLSDAQRIYRTESTRIEGQAMQDTAQEWQKATGKTAYKRWICTFHNSRDTHIAMNGQTIPVNARFISPSGATFAYPGDGSDAGAAEVINCQCRMEIVGDE